MDKAWNIEVRDGVRMHSGGIGYGFIHETLEEAEKKDSELTWLEWVGRKLFRGRYFHPVISDVVSEYEQRHGRSYKAHVSYPSEAAKNIVIKSV